jgi:hypothetical protein
MRFNRGSVDHKINVNMARQLLLLLVEGVGSFFFFLTLSSLSPVRDPLLAGLFSHHLIPPVKISSDVEILTRGLAAVMNGRGLVVHIGTRAGSADLSGKGPCRDGRTLS